MHNRKDQNKNGGAIPFSITEDILSKVIESC